MVAEVLQHFPHGSEPVRAAIEVIGTLQHARPNTGFREIVRMNELIDVFTVVEHWDFLALVNPLKKDLEDSQPTVTGDGAGADDRDIQTFPRVLPAQGLSSALGSAILLHARRAGLLRAGICIRGQIDVKDADRIAAL